MTGHVRHVEAGMPVIDGEVVDKVSAEIHGRVQTPPESVAAETAVVFRKKLELNAAPGLFILLELLQGLGQLPVQYLQVLTVFPVLA